MTRKDLISKLDKEFSLYVRRVNSKQDLVACFTCDKVYHWKEVDCGHFIGRKNMSTRWDPDNARPQCKHCNQYHHGKTKVYRQRLGEETANRLLFEGNQTIKWEIHELERMLELFKKINKAIC